MWSYLKQHEAFVRAVLAGEYGEQPLDELAAFHHRQLAFLQQERLVHLLVTLFFAAFLLASLGFALLHGTWTALALCALLLVLESAYIVHYFRLENGVQRLYHLANAIELRRGRLAARYDSGPSRHPAVPVLPG